MDGQRVDVRLERDGSAALAAIGLLGDDCEWSCYLRMEVLIRIAGGTKLTVAGAAMFGLVV